MMMFNPIFGIFGTFYDVHTSLDWDPCQRIHPRANSAGQLVRSPSPDSDDEDGEAGGEAVTKLQLTRLATSDLRNLELRSVLDQSDNLTSQ